MRNVDVARLSLVLTAGMTATGCSGGTVLAGYRGEDSVGEADAYADDARDSTPEVDAAPEAGPEAVTDADGAPRTDDDEFYEWDLGPPGDGVTYEADAAPPIDDHPGCGNGVLDPGEECDDRNRLDGDGCDWLCRPGDGEPSPPADPDTSDYVPSGDPALVIPDVGHVGWVFAPPPLTWNGAEYATVLCSNDSERSAANFRFLRFDAAGRRVGPMWSYDAGDLCVGHDLVWNGSGYGLFFADITRGVFLLRLDADGKPMGGPLLVEPDPQARSPAADLADEGYVLAWTHETDDGHGWSVCGGWGPPEDSVRVRRVGTAGETAGDPLIVEEAASGTVDIATGDGGFGLSIWMNSSPDLPSCAQRFALLSDDFTRVVPSGILSDGATADVKWATGRYYTAWVHYDTMGGGDAEICVARFSVDGRLEDAPVCTPSLAGSEWSSPVRTAAGDGGLATVVADDYGQQFLFLRTDLRGAAVAPPYPIVTCDAPPRPDCPAGVGNYNAAWADRGFGVIFTGHFVTPTIDAEGLFLLTFAAG